VRRWVSIVCHRRQASDAYLGIAATSDAKQKKSEEIQVWLRINTMIKVKVSVRVFAL